MIAVVRVPLSILTQLRQFASVLRGRVQLTRPGLCDRCPAVITWLTALKAETYGLVGEVTCPRCQNGIVRPAHHIARAAYYRDGEQP